MEGIACHDLRFTYPGATVAAVDGVSLQVNSGEVLALLGPSGAGKSTTQKILTGRLHGWVGSVSVLGQAFGDGTGKSLDRSRIGVSFEEPAALGKLTGREHLEFFGALYDRPSHSAVAILDAVGLSSAVDARTSTYSKGMRVRLDLARALLHKPDVLFLDEPTAGLDPTSAGHVRELIRSQADAGAAVLLATHDMILTEQISDRVAMIVDGRVVRCGSPRQLRLSAPAPLLRVEYHDGGKLLAQEFNVEMLAENDAFLALLRTADIDTMHTTEPSLADVFVDITGRRLP